MLLKRRAVLNSLLASAFLPTHVLAKGFDYGLKPLSYGLAKDVEWYSSTHRELMESHGLTDHAVVFYNLLSPENVEHPYDWVRIEYLDRDIPVVLTLLLNGVDEHSLARSEASEGAAVDGFLDRITGGYYDAELVRLAERIAADGRPIIVRHMHEWDGNWYGWNAYANGNTVQAAIDAYIHVVEVFKAAKAPVQFELNLNRRDGKSPPGVMSDIEVWFPQLDLYVDMYAISTYNRCKTNANAYQEWRSFTEEFAPAYEALASWTPKPINVAEVATTDLCGPRLPWYVNMLGDIDELFPQVQMVTFYLATIPVGAASNDVAIEWNFPMDSQVEAFRRVIELRRQLVP